MVLSIVLFFTIVSLISLISSADLLLGIASLFMLFERVHSIFLYSGFLVEIGSFSYFRFSSSKNSSNGVRKRLERMGESIPP